MAEREVAPAPPVRDGAAAGGDRLQELRAILLDPERERIRALERTLANPALHVDEVARVLPEAITRRATSDERLGDALGPVVGEAIKASVRRDPQPLVDAIFPVMGPAIRRAIANALGELVQSLNTTLEHTVSVRGLAWRWEAMRTGRSFGEVVLSHSLLYRVEQLFVIHRETGLLIDHRTAPGVQALSPDLVASMMTALRDFARDSFRVSEQEGLDAMALGELKVWAESGPEAMVAAVIRGQPPMALREVLQRAVEELHLAHPDELERFAGSGVAFAVREGILERCLVSQSQQPARAGSAQWRTWLLAALVLAAVGWCAVPRVMEGRRFDGYLEALRREPGVVVGSSGRAGGRYIVTGLRDPLARDPRALAAQAGLDSARVEAKWEPYVALRPEFVVRRAAALLSPPASVTLRLAGDTLVVAGVAPDSWRREAERLARAVPGVGALRLTELADSAGVALRAAADAIERVAFDYPLGGTLPVAADLPRVDSLAALLSTFLANAELGRYEPRITLLGSADSVGTEATNAALRRARAERMRQALQARGVTVRTIVAVPDSTDDPTQRKVRLRIALDRR
jgi:OOP family OmpA-OmpF porin